MKGPTSHAWLFVVIAMAIYIREATSSPPNVVLFVIDDMEWLEQFKDIAPKGVNLEGKAVEMPDYKTANITRFQSESVVFPKTYCGGPKCAPSRYSMLTGRMPSRSEASIQDTLDHGNGAEGTEVTVSNCKLTGYDSEYNVPKVLQENGYHTGQVGKWHLMTPDDNGNNVGCADLAGMPNLDLYKQCTLIVKEQGFDFVDGFFYTNIPTNDYFNHNPEWMVSSAQRFIDEAVADDKPFFLYFASTLTHSAGDVFTALDSFKNTETPKGTLTGADVPDDTAMATRAAIWHRARIAGTDQQFPVKKKLARYFWMDEQFGALIAYLQDVGVYDDTMVILQSDHGMGAKGTMYEMGSRILNFVRYPPLFGTQQTVLSDDIVVSNVDLAATIFELAGAPAPSGYRMDGTSWLTKVTNVVNQAYATQVDTCCDYRFIDIFNSRSIVSANYQYIWRANENVETANDVDHLYPNTLDHEQFYDLNADPDQKVNLIADASLSSTIMTFQTMMRDYIRDTCPASDGVCAMPPLVGPEVCSEIIYTHTYRFFNNPELDAATQAAILTKAEERFAGDVPDCAMQGYWYLMTTYFVDRVRLDMDICCGADGAVFPDDYAPPDGYLHSEGP